MLFIDEVDGLSDRVAVDARHRPYWSGFVGSVLEQMDGIQSQPGVIVLGATNHLEAVDRALLRSGRFDRIIRIDVPEPKDLVQILRQKLGSDLAGEDLMPVAVLGLVGTGADAERWVRGARRRARYQCREVTVEDLAVEVSDGSGELEPGLLRRCAVHEAGHGIAAVLRGDALEVEISLGKRAGFAGSTRAIGREEALTVDVARRRLTYLLAGRAAEEIVLGSVSGGAGGMDGSDLAMATRLAIDMVTAYGLTGPEPLVYWGAGIRPFHLPPHLFSEVRRELSTAYTDACELLRKHRQAVERLADHLAANLAASDLIIRAIVRENTQLRENAAGTNTRH